VCNIHCIIHFINHLVDVAKGEIVIIQIAVPAEPAKDVHSHLGIGHEIIACCLDGLRLPQFSGGDVAENMAVHHSWAELVPERLGLRL